jgi:hypothetical protein
LEGSGSGLIEVLSWFLLAETEKTTEHLRVADVPPRNFLNTSFEPYRWASPLSAFPYVFADVIK